MRQPNQVSFIINLEPSFIQNGEKFDDDFEQKKKPYKSAIAIAAPNEENDTLTFSYFRWDEQESKTEGMIEASSSQLIPLPMAIKGFLSGTNGSIV